MLNIENILSDFKLLSRSDNFNVLFKRFLDTIGNRKLSSFKAIIAEVKQIKNEKYIRFYKNNHIITSKNILDQESISIIEKFFISKPFSFIIDEYKVKHINTKSFPLNISKLPQIDGSYKFVIWQSNTSQNQYIKTLIEFLISEIKWRLKSEKANNLIYIDNITGLYNIRFIINTIDNEIHRSKRFKNKFSLLFIDLDNFKTVNDKYGHLAGNDILQQVSKIIKLNLRQVDKLGRYGGDEFVAILLEVDSEVATNIAERIRLLISNQSYRIMQTNQKIKITASIGIAAFPENGRTQKALLEVADISMYKGKSMGKNKVISPTYFPSFSSNKNLHLRAQ